MDFNIFSFLLLTLAVLGVAFFSGLETAITSASIYKIKAENDTGNKRYSRILELLHKKENLISMCVIGNNITLVLVTILLSGLAKTPLGKIFLTVFETVVIVIFAEIIPKAIFRKSPEKLLLLSSYPILIFRIVFYPLTFLSISFSFLLLKIFGYESKEKDLEQTREEIAKLVSLKEKDQETSTSSSGSNTSPDEWEQVKAVLDLKETQAAAIMTPKNEFCQIEENKSLKDLLSLAGEKHFTRIPTYKDNSDNISGYININSLLRAKKKDAIVNYIHNPMFIPETLSVSSLIQKMQEKNEDIVFVVNEYGNVMGLISWEDIIEEVIGEVYSVERSEQDRIKEKKNGLYSIDCKISIEDLNDRLNLNLKSDTERTLAGYLLEIFGYFPKTNTSLHKHLREKYKQDNLSEKEIKERLKEYPDFIIKKRTKRAILSVELQLTPQKTKQKRKNNV